MMPLLRKMFEENYLSLAATKNENMCTNCALKVKICLYILTSTKGDERTVPDADARPDDGDGDFLSPSLLSWMDVFGVGVEVDLVGDFWAPDAERLNGGEEFSLSPSTLSWTADGLLVGLMLICGFWAAGGTASVEGEGWPLSSVDGLGIGAGAGFVTASGEVDTSRQWPSVCGRAWNNFQS